MRRTVLALVFYIIGGAWLLGCYTDVPGPELRETARVETTIYTPAQHGSGLGYCVTCKGGGLSVTSVDIDPVWGVVFVCQHGKFVIEGSSPRYVELWQRLHPGDSVDVTYREIVRVKENGERHLIKYDFLDARVRP